MESKNVNNHNGINMKCDLDKKIHKKIFYDDIVKSSKKMNSKIPIFSDKFNNNIIELRKSKNNHELTLNNTKKYSNKKQILTEKIEKIERIPKLSKIHITNKDINKNNKKIKKNGNDVKNQNKKNNQFNNKDIKEKILSSKSNSKKNKNYTKSLLIMNTPKLNDNSETDIITSHEKNVSELKTPKTLSDDSII